MIDPRDIFNAHRVVGKPISYRPTTSTRPPMMLPIAPAFRDPKRRRVTLRAVRRAAGDQTTAARAIIRRVESVARKR